ncbi:membrane-targeted effector domain-containing toxin [Pseudomonas asplenii]|uniref:membrane-targeted effector domain-containing toxin n=1 Tax=Pseudomonas asplenii TaxID=53407 RepID=UPI0037CAF801
MSPKTPIRPGTPGTGSADTPTIRPTELSPPLPPRLPGTGHPLLPGIPAAHLSTDTPSAPPTVPPGAAALAISSIAGTVANRLAPGRALSAYARPAPRGLLPPDSDGLRIAQQRRFVNLEDGRIVMVRYDESVRAYCAQAREEYLPSGPALYRLAGTDIWKENHAASALRPYQLPAWPTVMPQPGRSTTVTGRHPDEAAHDQILQPIRTRLLADAENFFKQHRLPARPPMPELPADIQEGALIEILYRQGQGVVIGERYTDSGSKLFLIGNMATLAENGVRTLYVERLRTDVDQVHLDDFHRSGNLSAALDSHLRSLDGDYADAPAGPHSYRSLIISARAHGIRVQALDCAASDSLRGPDAQMFTRATALNYHADRVIQADQVGGRQGKWLALVNLYHASGYAPKSPPGLSRLRGVIGLEIKNAMSGPAIRVMTVAKPDLKDPMRLVSPDLKLTVKVPWLEALEIPLPYRKVLQERIRNPEEIARRTHFKLGERAHDEAAITDFLEREEHLGNTSEKFFSWSDGRRHAQPHIPEVPADSTAARVFEMLYENNQGVVLAAEQGSLTARKLLLENLPALATLNVRKLYVQNLLTDLDQPFIDGFQATGILPERFQQALVSEDLRQSFGLANEYSLQRLLLGAREHGIVIQALDTAASYRKQRQKHNVPAFNYVAHKIIASDQQQHGAHKWLALVLNINAGPVRGIPGLAQLQGAAALRTVAIGPQAAARVSPDPGYVERVYGRNEYVRADLVLEVNTDSGPMPRASQDPRSCLGWLEVEPSFLVERQGDHFILVQKIYRTGQDHYRETVIEVQDGKYSIAPGTPLSNGVQYASIADLVWGLKGEGKVQVAEIPGVIPIPAVPRLDTHPQLNRPGMFIIDESANGPVLINRSRDRSLSVTPIRRTPSGKLYIQHRRWGYDDTQLFASREDLSRELARRTGLVPYSVPADL